MVPVATSRCAGCLRPDSTPFSFPRPIRLSCPPPWPRSCRLAPPWKQVTSTMVAELGTYVQNAAARGMLVVQPRMGMPDPEAMAAGIAAAARLGYPAVATITVDSYTRVGDHQAAARALDSGAGLNGFPLVAHGPGRTAQVAAAAGPQVPGQVRHGSAPPAAVVS